MKQQDQQQERVIGEEGLDLSNHAAVASWVSTRLAQHREAEKTYRQQLIEQGIDPDDKSADEVDLSAMPSPVRKMVEDGLKEYEQMEAQLRQQLAAVRPREKKGGGMNRWAKL
ncbi:MAG: hypothetical protein OXC81_07225 [Betaproteobacteria bacterium]|nr:hypothetical protein [Betaproteobacteria bacterium]